MATKTFRLRGRDFLLDDIGSRAQRDGLVVGDDGGSCLRGRTRSRAR